MNVKLNRPERKYPTNQNADLKKEESVSEKQDLKSKILNKNLSQIETTKDLSKDSSDFPKDSSKEKKPASIYNRAQRRRLAKFAKKNPDVIRSLLEEAIMNNAKFVPSPPPIPEDYKETLITRYKRYKTKIQEVLEALEETNVKIFDDNKEIRDFDQVMTELFAEWGTYSKDTQDKIAIAFAGVKKKEEFSNCLTIKAIVKDDVETKKVETEAEVVADEPSVNDEVERRTQC